MSYGSAIKKTKAQGFKSNTLEFQVSRDILFPKICIICGTNTEKKYNKTIYGANIATKDYTEDYILNIPVCINCTKNIDMKTGISSKSGKLILISSLFGLFIGIILYILTYSIFLSIGLFTLAIVLPIIKHRTNTKKKVKLNDFLIIELRNDKKSLKFDFLNEYYSRFIDEINSKKDTSEETEEKTD